MQATRKALWALLAVFASLLAISAIPGGVMLLAGLYSPPVEQLAGSVFRDFTLPGLALLVLVGGSAAAGAVLLIRRHRLALPVAMASGLAVMVFEFVEVLVIGSPPGPARAMQIVYFSLGFCLVAAVGGVLLIDGFGSAQARSPAAGAAR